jgi:hypothetical protein
MKYLFILIFGLLCSHAFAQNIDTTADNKVVVHMDYRLDMLARKEAELNTETLRALSRIGHGYRLMILNTNDRAYAMKVRGDLLQKFPEQKTYMWFANPYIKIKFGNFLTKEEADYYKNKISKMLNGATIYYLPENIEVKPDKDFNPDAIN